MSYDAGVLNPWRVGASGTNSQTFNRLNLLIRVDCNPYLESLCNAYTQWWTFGTLNDVVEPKRFEFDLMVQTVERDTQQRNKDEQTEQNLLILGLNSAWQLDHHYKTRANIQLIALSNA